MNIESVKERITSLETAGELSIKEQFYLASMKAHVALAAENAALSAAITDIIAERQRQQSAEGWTPEHDDEHGKGEMVFAAISYLMAVVNPNASHGWWPWDAAWWKPTNPRRDLVKAGALIAAEIERIDRAASQSEQVKGVQS